MRGQFITAEYDNERNAILAHIRTDTGEKKHVHIVGFRPYFYVDSDEYVPDHPSLESVDNGYKSVYDIDVKKIVMVSPYDMRNFKQRFQKSYEADIKFTRRFMIDMGISNGVEFEDTDLIYYEDIKPVDYVCKPVISYIDIEVETDIRFPDSKVNPIICISLYDEFNKHLTVIVGDEAKIYNIDDSHKVMVVESEAEVIAFLNHYLQKVSPDIITGWNVIDFDIKYLYDRAEILGEKLSFAGVCKFDMLDAYRSIYRKGSNRLKDVVIAEELVTEVVAEQYDGKWYKQDQELLIKYNKMDVEYVRLINEKHHLSDFYWMMKSLSGLEDMISAMHHSTLVDTLVMRLYHNHYVLPSKPSKDSYVRGEDGYEGAKVFDPPRGVFENVATFDMTKYYPSIIIAYNLSPEGKGFLTKLCKMLIAEREKLDNLLKQCVPGSTEYEEYKPRRDAFKYFLNAVYGYLGSPMSRLYCKDIAEKITAVGRQGLEFLKGKSEAKNQRVLYGDTDSILVALKDYTPEEFEEYLNDGLIEFANQEKIEPILRLKFEKLFTKILFTGAKKRYAGWVTREGAKKADYIHVTGFEFVRGDSCRLTKNLQYKTFECILKGDKEDIKPFIRDMVKQIRDGEVNIDDIVVPKTLSKDFSEYKNTPDYVRGCIYANAHFGADIHAHDKIKMLYVKAVPGYPKTDIVCFLDKKVLPENVVIDYEKIIEKTVKDKVKDVLDIVDIQVDTLIGKGYTKTLLDVFG